MNRPGTRYAVVAVLVVAVLGVAAAFLVEQRPRRVTVDYPLADSVFPPEFPPPTFLWHDASPRARAWTIDVSFGEGAAASLHALSRGEPPRIGESDPRAVGKTNEPPRLTPGEATAHAWKPDSATWSGIKEGSTATAAVLTITGYADETRRRPVSRGQVSIRTSTDPVGAPIFYRDVPLMPSEGEKGVIKPLDQKFVPLIAWRFRNVAETTSRVVMDGPPLLRELPLGVAGRQDRWGWTSTVPGTTRASTPFSRSSRRRRSASENVIEWSTFRGKLGGKLRVAFMSQVSPDGRYVMTTINDPGQGQTDYQRRQLPQDLQTNYYVANFKDYRFLQVFYPTRGILAWYSKATGRLQPLPGADDPRYVHTDAVWSPDGKYLVFCPGRSARTPIRTGVEAGRVRQRSERDADPVRPLPDPFNGGRGGRAGADRRRRRGNGMSNSFPKVSPDGRWIVFVQARNGQLMRPDGQLYIVPVGGGEARRMRANTPLMNSWHSFSPNGRWLVFSSKSRSPYTQMFLTHVDEEGDDSPGNPHRERDGRQPRGEHPRSS